MELAIRLRVCVDREKLGIKKALGIVAQHCRCSEGRVKGAWKDYGQQARAGDLDDQCAFVYSPEYQGEIAPFGALDPYEWVGPRSKTRAKTTPEKRKFPKRALLEHQPPIHKKARPSLVQCAVCHARYHEGRKFREHLDRRDCRERFTRGDFTPLTSDPHRFPVPIIEPR
jgi:hypothetical protein